MNERGIISEKWGESCSVISNSLRSHGLYSSWNSPGQNTGVCSLPLLQRISFISGRFLTNWAITEAPTSEEELNTVEISNLSKKKFMIVIIKMSTKFTRRINEHSENLNKASENRKNQIELKNTMPEIIYVYTEKELTVYLVIHRNGSTIWRIEY